MACINCDYRGYCSDEEREFDFCGHQDFPADEDSEQREIPDPNKCLDDCPLTKGERQNG